ncbi:MAG: response regulator [Clostridiales bacterium]|nr:response regulator [Clostridiales bacterium]
MLGKKVLIVDDAAFMRLSIRKILEKNGYEIVGEAENGIMAIEKYSMLYPDIVTMDITMPSMDGIEALKNIRKINPGSNVIMITAVGQENLVREAVISGARGFVVKPFKDETLLSAMKNI